MNDAAEKTAVLSQDGFYRYSLGRRWGEGKPVTWIMLNPSTADAEEDDPTIRKCIGFTKRLGQNALEVVNLFAIRATHPNDMKRHSAPIGPDNDGYIIDACTRSSLVICAWGKHGRFRNRDQNVIRVLHSLCIDRYCLSLNGDGTPAHPLMLGYDRGAVLKPYGENRALLRDAMG